MATVPKITETYIKKIQDFREEKKFCDVTLISNPGNFKVNAHKMILSLASDYFLKMFSTPIKDSDQNEVNVQSNEETLKAVIDYIYTDCIELKPNTVEDVFKAAHLFEIAPLKTICTDFMTQELDPTNCLGIYQFAELYALETLLKSSNEFVSEHFTQVCGTVQFLKLNVDQFSDLISSDDLKISSEEDVFRSLQLWVEHDKVHRLKHMEKLLHHIRYQQLSTEFIADEIETTCTSSGCRKYLFKAYKWHSLPLSRRVHSKKQMNRKIVKHLPLVISNWSINRSTITVITGWSRSNSILDVGIYCPEKRKWAYKSLPGLPVGLSKFASCTFQDQLIIAGGILNDTQMITNSVYSLDLNTLKWTSLPPLAKPRHSFKIAANTNFVCAVGGINDEEWVKDVEIWSSSRNEWTVNSDFQDPSDFKNNPNCYYVCADKNSFIISILTTGGPVAYFCDPSANTVSIVIPHLFDQLKNSWEFPFESHNSIFFKSSIKECTIYYRNYIYKSNRRIKQIIDPPISDECEKLHTCEFDSEMIACGINFFRIYKLDESADKWKMQAMEEFENSENDVVLIPNFKRRF